jgi:hypothetical protein
MTIISPTPADPADAPEKVSLTGTAFLKIPMPGRPECTGLLVDDDHDAIVRIEDGALVIDVDDIDLALAWRNAWQQAVSHLINHRERRAARQQNHTPGSETQA